MNVEYNALVNSDQNLLVKYSLSRARHIVEEALIREVVTFTGAHETRRASALLGISYRGLLYKMRKYGIPLVCSRCAEKKCYNKNK